MLTKFRTFTSRRLSFAEALEDHEMVKEPAERLQARIRSTGRKLKNCIELVELWDGILGVSNTEACSTCIPLCVELTIPPEYIPVVRGISGVVAAYAFCELAKALAQGPFDLNDEIGIRQAMVEGWREFEKRRQAANDVESGFGCDESQSWHTLRDIEDESSGSNLVDQMRAIAQLAGRLYQHFGYQRREHPNEDPEEVKGAKQGGDIERALPTELAMLADEDLEDVQAMKLLMANAPTFEMEGKAEQTRGPLVLVIDESGSMADHYSNGWNNVPVFKGRNTWAKAAAVALTRIAWHEGRAVRAVHFGTGTATQEIPKDDYRALFEMSRSFLDGGTAFGPALMVGMKQVGDLAAQGHAGADILLITDGVEHNYPLHDQVIDQMDQAGVQLWTIAIGVSIPSDAPVHKRAQRYTMATDSQLSNPNSAVTLATGLDQIAKGNGPDRGMN